MTTIGPGAILNASIVEMVEMGRFLIVLVLGGVVIGGGLIGLASWNIPAPTAHVEKVLPDEAFPR